MLPIMVPRTPASGRQPDRLLITSVEPPFSSRSVNVSTPLSHSSSSRLRPARALHYNTPSSSLSPGITASAPTATPSSASSSSPSSTLDEIEAWKFETETALDRLISQAEYALQQQRQQWQQEGGVWLGEDDAEDGDGVGGRLSASQEREVKELLLHFERLKHESVAAMDEVRQSAEAGKENRRPAEEQKEGEEACDAAVTSPVSSGSALRSPAEKLESMRAYVSLLEEKVDRLSRDRELLQQQTAVAQQQAEQLQSLRSQHAVALSAMQAVNAAQADSIASLQQELRSSEQLCLTLQSQLSDASDELEALRTETRESASRLAASGRELQIAQIEKLLAQEATQREQRTVRLLKEDGEALRVELGAVSRQGQRTRLLLALLLFLLLAAVGVDKWLHETMLSQAAAATF